MIDFREDIRAPHPALLIVPFYLSLIISGDSQISRGIFYLTALYAFSWLWKRKSTLQRTFNSSTLTGIAFISYIALSALWGGGNEIDHYLRWGIGLATFWIILIILAQTSEKHLAETALALIIFSCIAAAYSTTHYFLSADAPPRNEGPGILRHPILGPSVLISVSATAVMILQYCKRFPAILIGILFFSLLIYTLTTESRGPLLSLGIWALALIVTSPIRKEAKLIATFSGLLFILAIHLSLPDFISSLIARGSTYRIEIWKTVTPTLGENFFFGKGVSLDFVKTETSMKLKEITGLAIEHPHNLGLSTWLYCGAVGLILLIGTTLSGAAILYKKNPGSLFYCLPLICTTLFLSLTDIGKLITSPSAIWFIFWLPFAILSGLSARDQKPTEISAHSPRKVSE